MSGSPAGEALQLGGRLALARGSIDRAAERRGDTEWLLAAWARPTTAVLVVDDGRVPVDLTGPDSAADAAAATAGMTVRWSSPADVDPAADRCFLGATDDGHAWFAVAGSIPEGTPTSTLRELGPLLDDDQAGLVVHGVAIVNWHAAHPCCAICGARTVVDQAGHVRRCPVDESLHFPRTDPAIIVLITDGDGRCLLGRHPAWPPDRYSTLAGFVEPGESLEQAVAREVREEVGIGVDAIRYAGSQPWPFPSSLMLGFFASATTTEIHVDGDEISDARWFSRDDVVAAVRAGRLAFPGSVSISRRLIEAWFGAPLPVGPSRDD